MPVWRHGQSLPSLSAIAGSLRISGMRRVRISGTHKNRSGVRYEERGPAVSESSRRARTSRMIRTLQKLGYRVELLADPA